MVGPSFPNQLGIDDGIDKNLNLSDADKKVIESEITGSVNQEKLEVIDNPSILLRMGKAALEVEDYDTALYNISRSIDIDPRDISYYYLGFIYYKMNKFEQAEEALKISYPMMVF